MNLIQLRPSFGSPCTPLFSGFTSNTGQRSQVRIEYSGMAYSTPHSRRLTKKWKPCGCFMHSTPLLHCTSVQEPHRQPSERYEQRSAPFRQPGSQAVTGNLRGVQPHSGGVFLHDAGERNDGYLCPVI